METKEKKTEEVKKRFLVVSKLPEQEVRVVLDEHKEEVELITMEEALTEILENTRKIVKAL